MSTDHQISQWKVLIVDDDSDNLGIPEQYLAHYGAEVKTAGNGEEALKALEGWEPTLILLDLSMPVMDGWEMLKRVRANPAIAAVPVIALTAHAMQEDERHVLEAGFNGYIAKPFMLPTFIQDIKRCLEHTHR